MLKKNGTFLLQLMAETASPQTLSFRGERMSWVSPVSLEELVQLKTSNPKAPLVLGNTNIGIKIQKEQIDQYTSEVSNSFSFEGQIQTNLI